MTKLKETQMTERDPGDRKMNAAEIQKRVNALTAAMTAKGMRQPRAEVHIKANEEPAIYLTYKRGLGRTSFGSEEWKFFYGDLRQGFKDASDYIAKQPDPEQAKLNDFMAALGSVIDIGKTHNIEVEFLNPLVATMKRLSENVITDQRAA